MKVLLFIFAISLSLGCYQFDCATSQQKLPNSQCAFFDDSTQAYYLQPCPSGYYCPFYNQAMNITCLQSPPPNDSLFPGDSCSSDNECCCGKCNSGICGGSAKGDVCTVQAQCNPGLSCVHKVQADATCQPLITEGGECGFFAESFCQNHLVCNNHKCIKYFSKENGSFVTLDTAKKACMSGMAKQINSEIGYCADAPSSRQSTMPEKCTKDSDCVSMTGFEASSCTCGFNANADSYCELFAGDDYNQAWMRHTAAYLDTKDIEKCHYEAVWTRPCAETVGNTADFEAAMMYQLMYAFWPEIPGNEDCVKETITSAYWNSTFIKSN